MKKIFYVYAFYGGFIENLLCKMGLQTKTIEWVNLYSQLKPSDISVVGIWIQFRLLVFRFLYSKMYLLFLLCTYLLDLICSVILFEILFCCLYQNLSYKKDRAWVNCLSSVAHCFLKIHKNKCARILIARAYITITWQLTLLWKKKSRPCQQCLLLAVNFN